MPIPAQALVTEIGNASVSRSPAEIMEIARSREASLSRLVMAYVSSGLLFMLLPGTFLGVWNLLQISKKENTASVSPAWLQAHGHAQVFGWIGSFIFGIGFYAASKLRHAAKPTFGAAWSCWVMWTLGVTARWLANVYQWHWRALLPASALLEIAAFLIFFSAVSRHKSATPGKQKIEPWAFTVIAASLGLMSALAVNLGATIHAALQGDGPALPHVFDQHYLALLTWGFLVPFVWGFSSKWLAIFLGLKPLRPTFLFSALGMNLAGIILTFAGREAEATALFVVGAISAIVAIRIFESSVQPAKTRGVHWTFPYFIRIAYAWLLIASFLGVAASLWDSSGGIWGASRHALTVGFIAIMVLSVGQRILPAFAGMRLLWSTRLTFVALALLAVGCTFRVFGEVVAYQGYASWAWSILPTSAVLELTGITAFAVNIAGTFLLEPPRAQKQPLVVEMR